MDRPSRKQSAYKYAITDLPIKIFTSSSPTGSVLEIDVQGSVNFKSRPSSSSKEALALAKVAPLSLKRDSKETYKGMKVFANPFIESYYPVLKDPFSETISDLDQLSVKSINRSVVNEKKIQKKGKNEPRKKTETETSSDLIEKESALDATESSSDQNSLSLTHVKKSLKQEIIKNFAVKAEKESPLKSLPQSSGKADDEQLHLHHHEHHHHYYFDPKQPPSQVDHGPTATKREGFQQSGLFSESSKKWIGEEEFHNNVFQNNGSEKAGSPYLYGLNPDCPTPFIPDVNLYCSTGTIFLKNSKTKVTKFENTSKIFTRSFFSNEANYLQATNLKPSSSSDTLIGEKKSDLIATHNYSDTELHKYLNESGHFSSSLTTHSPNYFMMFNSQDFDNVKEKNPKPNCDKIIERLKKLDCFLASKVVSDAKQTSNIAYIRREYMTTEGVQTVETMASDNGYKGLVQTKPLISKQEKAVGTSSNSISPQRSPNSVKTVDLLNTLGQQGIFPESLLFVAKEKDAALQRKKASLKSWTEKLKHELREIKKELSVIEERHTRKYKRSSTAIFHKALVLGDQNYEFLETCEETDESVEVNKFSKEKNVIYCVMPSRNSQRRRAEHENDNKTSAGKRKPTLDKRRISKHYKVFMNMAEKLVSLLT